MSRSRNSDLELAQKLSADGEVDDAYAIANRYLKNSPNDVEFLTVMLHVMLQSDKTVIGYHLARRAAQLAPTASGVWLNMGKAAADLWLTNESIRSYRKAIKHAKEDSQLQLALVNMCAVLVDAGRFAEAEPYAKQVLEISPDDQKGTANLGFCQLAQRNWTEGWKNYRRALGHDWRPRSQYFGEPEWDGKKTGKVILYAEQGIGDVMSFASMLPDAQKKAKIVIDVDPKLHGLLQRSFPDVSVYPTRFSQRKTWAEEDTKVDASLPMGQCGEYFRLKDEDFPGTPYLVPDPDRVLMWKALFEQKRKPRIGIAWRGGILATGSKFRQWSLSQLVPLLKSVDAHWVSLQYKPAQAEINALKEKHPEIDIVEYPHGTLTQDYDDTAALVASLDMVVCMQTAVTHLCGGLGTPVWVFLPQSSQWRYGAEGEDYIWAKSVRMIRQTKQGEWAEDIERTAGELRERFKKRTKRPTKLGRNGVKTDRQLRDRPSA